jgi:hypothetical protein
MRYGNGKGSHQEFLKFNNLKIIKDIRIYSIKLETNLFQKMFILSMGRFKSLISISKINSQ